MAGREKIEKKSKTKRLSQGSEKVNYEILSEHNAKGKKK